MGIKNQQLNYVNHGPQLINCDHKENYGLLKNYNFYFVKYAIGIVYSYPVNTILFLTVHNACIEALPNTFL